jgi:hypothetical protein
MTKEKEVHVVVKNLKGLFAGTAFFVTIKEVDLEQYRKETGLDEKYEIMKTYSSTEEAENLCTEILWNADTLHDLFNRIDNDQSLGEERRKNIRRDFALALMK